MLEGTGRWQGMKVIRNICLMVVSLLSYWGGFYAYEQTLRLVWGQTLGGDKPAVLFWSLIAFLLLLVPLYLFICVKIKSKIKRASVRMIGYPIFCACIFSLPTMFIMRSFGGGSLFSPESQLFNSFFLSSGIIFGIGYGLISFKFDKPIR